MHLVMTLWLTMTQTCCRMVSLYGIIGVQNRAQLLVPSKHSVFCVGVHVHVSLRAPTRNFSQSYSSAAGHMHFFLKYSLPPQYFFLYFIAETCVCVLWSFTTNLCGRVRYMALLLALASELILSSPLARSVECQTGVPDDPVSNPSRGKKFLRYTIVEIFFNSQGVHIIILY